MIFSTGDSKEAEPSRPPRRRKPIRKQRGGEKKRNVAIKQEECVGSGGRCGGEDRGEMRT